MDDNGGFLGALATSDLILWQHEATEIGPLIDHVEGKNVTIPGHLSQSLDLRPSKQCPLQSQR